MECKEQRMFGKCHGAAKDNTWCGLVMGAVARVKSQQCISELVTQHVHCGQHRAEWLWDHRQQPAIAQELKAPLSRLPGSPAGEQPGKVCVFF